MNAFRRAVPLLLLGLALVATVVGAVAAHRAQTGHRAAAEALLRDYGAFAAWSFQQAASDVVHEVGRAALYPPRTELYPDPGGDGEEPDPAGALARLLEDAGEEPACGCRAPMAGDFAFRLPIERGSGSLFVGSSVPPREERERIAREVRSKIGAGHPEEHEHGIVVIGDPRDGHRILGWARLRGRAGPVVYGMEFDADAVAALLHDAFTDRVLLPPSLTRGRRNRDLLALTVESPEGAVLYDSDPRLDREEAGHVATSASEEIVVRASVRPDVAGGLVIGGLPRSQVPWMLLLFGLAGLLAALAVSYLRRENRLALQRTDFMASVSHELRTPLAQIRLFVETLRLGRVETEEKREWALRAVDRETLRLTRLVENILRFSRTEKGVEVHSETVDVEKAAGEVVEDFRPLIPDDAARLEVDVQEDLRAQADPDALRQILTNFIDNAIKYGPRGQTVRIRGEAVDGCVRISVADEGPGVPPRERDSIWGAFRRGRRAQGSTATGSGIGLSVVLALARAQEGRCWVEEAEGGGARFVVELPGARPARPRRVEGRAAPPSGSRQAGKAGIT